MYYFAAVDVFHAHVCHKRIENKLQLKQIFDCHCNENHNMDFILFI